ncbi:MAG: substrate-binding domain-containing protein [Peptococcaceae bacterium]|nr:substrate-binding domain-containing protein [Peptococcaceae bacterium]
MVAAIIVVFIFRLLAGCGGSGQSNPQDQNAAAPPQKDRLILATTTSTYDSGLLDKLVPVFEEKTGYNVDILPKGTGACLELGKNGDADVLLVHAKDRELQMVQEGYFVDRHDVMYNDFVILGPANDPAGIKGQKDAAKAFKAIAGSKSTFVSRGDNSGTNMKEMAVWEKAGLEPTGDWYLAVGQGMGETLRIANEKQAYTLSDRGTYLAMRDKLTLEVLVEDDPVLFNQYGVMAVNPDKNPNVNYKGAKKFIEFMISPEAQEIIGSFTKYGEQLFKPNA